VHATLVTGVFVAAAVTAAALLLITAPYGRHGRAGWGPQLPAKLGWVVMESPAVLLFVAVYAQGAHRADAAPLVLLALWQLHYVQRTFVFPLLMRGPGRPMPVLIVLLALAFNGVNAYVNAWWIAELGHYPTAWLRDPRFLAGAAIFLAGWLINLRADAALRNLRAPGEQGYKIPRGGLYERVSCPNYLGELLEWTGWTIATWSLAGLSFAVYTAANLVPRALANHRWYRERFPDYPAERRAVIPYVL
jgi:protein-S-isoprenylcysteine O-methyltransferase Ste14